MDRRDLLRSLGGVLVVGAVAPVVAACGDDDETTAGDEPTGTGTVGEAAPTTTAVAGPDITRVVSLGFEDEVLSLDVVPVGAGMWTAAGYPPHLADLLADVPDVGLWYEPNLEALAGVRPSLVLSDAYVEETFGTELGQLAPLAVIDFDYVEGGTAGVRALLGLAGAAMGLEDRAEARLEEHRRRMAEAAEAVAGRFGTVAFLRIRPDELRVVTPSWGYIGPVIYGDLGLTPPDTIVELDARDTDRVGFVAGSIELLDSFAGADHVFYLADEEEDRQAIEANPLWRGLPAVAAGNVHRVDAQLWQTTACLANEAKAADVVRVAEAA